MKQFSVVVGALGLLSLAGCGGGGGNSPTPVTTSTPPASANLSVRQTVNGQLCFSPSPAHTFRLALPVQVTESGGLGANINFARLQLFLGGAEIERAEVTADGIIAAFGSNAVPANNSLAGTLNFDFNSSDFDGRALFMDFTDRRGGPHDFTIGTINLDATVFCTVLQNTSTEPGRITLERRE